MSCDKCKELEAKLDALNADIEKMFLYAFKTGYKIGSDTAITAIRQTVDGALNSGLFPDLAKGSMREYFNEVNPPHEGEKD